MRSIVVLFALGASVAAAQPATPVEIRENRTFEKGAVLKTPLVIAADDVVVDGNGATLVGPGAAGDLKTFAGNGISADGRKNVTIRNFTVRGFKSALVASNGSGWTIENCDFSGNYHDPDHGWGDGERVGGIILTGMDKCTIRNCKANNNWNACDLWESDENTIAKNDFSHCSNTCLKLWNSSKNSIEDSNLSWGLRMNPGEVHARDSTSVLIESGSNDNRFERNDVTHGGDGIFIRVLNGWCSTGNVFIENDCSYANNNGFEAWSPGNTYIRNKANHCSYGFWLGGSDHTVLIENEAAFNGQPDGKHNAPEPDFIHGGIVIVHGSGTHTVIERNYCHDNNGAGIVFRGDLGTRGAKWKMHHLIVQNNRLENNKWGLYARFTDWLFVANNTFKDNEQDEFLEEVTGVVRGSADPQNKPAPTAGLEGPTRVQVGQKASFDASKSEDAAGRKLTFDWRVGDKTYDGARVEHTFEAPGFYRVGVNASNGHLAGLAFLDVYAFKPVQEIATENGAGAWGWELGNNRDRRGKVVFRDDPDALVGQTSLHFRPEPYPGSELRVFAPSNRQAGWDLTKKRALSFWLKFRNPNNGFQGPHPLVRLHAGKADVAYTPLFNGMPRNLLGDLPYSEGRYGWLYITIPLAGGDDWMRLETIGGARPPHFDNGLKFETVSTRVEAQSASALVSTPAGLFCATPDGDRVWKLAAGGEWQDVKRPRELGRGGGGWINGGMAFWAKGGEQGALVLRRGGERRLPGQDVWNLVLYDIAKDAWTRLPTEITPSHAFAIVGDDFFGLAHAVGGNYGGPLAHLNLAKPGAFDERSVLGPVKGKDAWWFSRAAQLVVVGDRIYGIKNDWQTPQPQNADEIGDRLYCFDPAAYQASDFSGDNRWDEKSWKEKRTPVTDLGPLPFEIGHGAAVAALPAKWCPLVGERGGLFIVSGCTPADHEGYGPPAAKYAIYDVASGKFTLGSLPDPTGSGTSAAFHAGKVFVKRGGMNYGPSNGEFFVVTPLSPEEARVAAGAAARERIDMSKIDCLSLQFDSVGDEPFDVWIDGLGFE